MFQGVARVDKLTKNLIKRLQPNEIAVIHHRDIDEVSAEGLIAAGVQAVLNADTSISGKYPNPGPLKILKAGIPLIDNLGPEIMEKIKEEQVVSIDDGVVYIETMPIAWGKNLTVDEVKEMMEDSKHNYNKEIKKFVLNTLEYAEKEIDLITKGIEIPELNTGFQGRHALIVVRGMDYKKDLNTIRSYIKDVRPVLVGVDGGADALLEAGYTPDMIVGDMDSVTDGALQCGAEVVVHAYRDGRAPGLERVKGLGVEPVIVKAPGTSEDIAMLTAYQKGAQLIVAVGTHSNVFDFLEKGRKGMSSTFLVRIKIGTKLVDAKGVNKLYKGSIRFRYVIGVIAAALIPLAVILLESPISHQFARLIVLQIKILLTNFI
ncbi:MAG: hypothetical protein GX318_01300 [Clostridia bacterium]|nr:hypothetical protein [Clostridia bacterium]